MTRFDQAAFDAKYAVYKYVNEHVVSSPSRAPVEPAVVQKAATELWGWLTESSSDVTVTGAPDINISDHIATLRPPQTVVGPIASTPVTASNFADAINETAERFSATIASNLVADILTDEALLKAADSISRPVAPKSRSSTQTGNGHEKALGQLIGMTMTAGVPAPLSTRQRIMSHLHAMGADGAIMSEIKDVLGIFGKDAGKRMREMLDRGEVVKDDQMPTRYWAKEYAVKPVMPPAPLQKHTKIDGSPLSSVMPDAGKLTHQALVALEIIRRPGTHVSIGGPMDIPTGCMSLGQAKRAFSELERLGFIGKLDGVWVALEG